MPLALFDLDNTLIAGDSDHAWGEFLVRQGIVDGEYYRRANDQFYEDYKRGALDIDAYLRFALAPLARFTLEELAALHRRFMADCIEPLMLPAARTLIDRHRAAGDRLLVITATNRFVTEPIVRTLGIDELLASEPEMADGRYTGRPAGIPCYQEGKVARLQAWLTEQGETLAGSTFYSDSHNDLPLLERVDHPVAVDPDDQLRAIATARGWPVISLR